MSIIVLAAVVLVAVVREASGELGASVELAASVAPVVPVASVELVASVVPVVPVESVGLAV